MLPPLLSSDSCEFTSAPPIPIESGLVASSSCSNPGPTKSPTQLPNTLTTATKSFPPPVILLFTKLTILAIMLASPVTIEEFPLVFFDAEFPPELASRFTLFTIFALLTCVNSLLLV